MRGPESPLLLVAVSVLSYKVWSILRCRARAPPALYLRKLSRKPRLPYLRQNLRRVGLLWLCLRQPRLRCPLLQTCPLWLRRLPFPRLLLPRPPPRLRSLPLLLQRPKRRRLFLRRLKKS